MERNQYHQYIFSVANYYIENKSTIRKTAEHFGKSKSTIHNYLTEDLYKVDSELAEKVKKLMIMNKSDAPRRGGRAVQQKYRELKAKEE